jgi:hypothetical protein
MQHIVQFSGGVGSWAAAKRVAERHGTEGMTLLFADTNMEDADLYRFLDEAAVNIGAPLVRIADGRTPWEVFFKERMMGGGQSAGADPCSKILKRELLDAWREEHCDKADTTVYVGIDWTEMHRMEGTSKKPGLRKRMASAGWTCEAPMCEAPYLSKSQMLSWLEREGICPPKLYQLGFPHNNCGGFCIKAGHDHFAHLLRVLPDRYAYHESKEQEFREFIGKDVAIMRDRRGGEDKPLTMKAFRERIQANASYLDFGDDGWGGCGCAIE